MGEATTTFGIGDKVVVSPTEKRKSAWKGTIVTLPKQGAVILHDTTTAIYGVRPDQGNSILPVQEKYIKLVAKDTGDAAAPPTDEAEGTGEEEKKSRRRR